MAFDLAKIKESHILKAVDKIAKEKLRLRPSIGYDVVIKGKRYPPKEIIRIAYKIAAKSDVGIIYGGEQVNKPLRDLGFEVVPKISVWKLGCNWGRGAPSFYDYIKENRLVLSASQFQYKIGDLILITEGFTVYAIAKVTSVLEPVTSNRRLLKFCDEYQIEYEEYVLYAGAEWYALQETEIFRYQLQQGIRKVQSREIIDRAIDIWDNRNRRITEFSFYVGHPRNSIDETIKFPCFILTSNSWDDYGFQTMFKMILYRSPDQKVEIGYVKILQKGNDVTSLPSTFRSLDQTFCSLGQTIEFYQRLKTELGASFTKVLAAMRDAAFNKKIRAEFSQYDGFSNSLLRASEAELVLTEFKNLVAETSPRVRPRSYNFSFRYQMNGASGDHVVDFQFNTQGELPNRIFCLIGRNGTGKTKFISQLASKLTNDEDPGSFHPKRPEFSKIIAVSFSYFDKFKFPKQVNVSYEFIGIKNSKGAASEEYMLSNIWQAFEKVSEDKRKKHLWQKCVEGILEVDYLNFDVQTLLNISNRTEFRINIIDIFSSGQKILFLFITRLISVIETNSLVIFDEPETHLHPNIAGRLLRTLNEVLKECNSFCILSTHSPIIVQQIPSRFIRIIDRKGNYPIVYRPAIECLGENLSNISNSIFHTSDEKELYKSTFEDLLESRSLKEIDELFGNQLSLNARLYIQATKNLK